MKRLAGFLQCILLSACCCSKPVPPLQEPLAPEPSPQDVTHRILAYGDTRTGVLLFESQVNFGEEVHDWVAKQMVARLKGEKAEVFFTGDAVYSGGASFHYDNFVTAVSKFKDAGLPFYPGVGNHELLAGILGVISPWFDGVDTKDAEKLAAQAKTPEHAEIRRYILERHQELGKVGHQREKLSKDTVARLDAKSQNLEASVMPKAEDQASTSPADERIQTAQRVMEEIYVKRAKFAHLEPIFSGQKRSFYSVEISKTKPTILAVMLDTNSLDYAVQKQWFQETLATSKHDLILVFGHHPPLTIDGWDADYMKVFREHKKAVVWIVSHVHSFVYAFPEPSPSPPLRGLFVSGGGGAPLVDSDEKVKPIEGWKFGPPDDLSGKFFHFLDIRTTKDSVYVTVVGCSKKGEPMTPRATYRISLIPS